MIRTARAPVRIDFAGGTTDIYPFTHRYGGCVLNAGINRYVKGKLVSTVDDTKLEYNADIPTGSGLGTSSAMNVVWLGLVSQIKDKKEIADTVYRLEQDMEIVGGKQDQYAAAFGGINYLEFKKDKTIRKEIVLEKKTLKKLESSLFLLYVGKPRYSSRINGLVINNLKRGHKSTIDALKNIKEIAFEMKESLEIGNLKRFARLRTCSISFFEIAAFALFLPLDLYCSR
jgi:D-glycero-alpha-D-manno-heptose-7-phosphate kinase